jgi:hypothetical protein
MMRSLALNLVATARRIPKKATGTTYGDVMSDEQLDATSSRLAALFAQNRIAMGDRGRCDTAQHRLG